MGGLFRLNLNEYVSRGLIEETSSRRAKVDQAEGLCRQKETLYFFGLTLKMLFLSVPRFA